MKTLVSVLTLSSLFIGIPAMAGSGHDHGDDHSHSAPPATQPVAEKNTEFVQQKTDAKQAEWKDTITLTIPAKGDKEYKLYLSKGARFDYAWQTDKGALFFDFHGEPKGDTTGYFKTFKKDTKSNASGSLTAEFAGTHGWYWKNNSTSPVVITLNVKGDYKRLDVAVNQETAEKNAKIKITALIGKNKLDQSWASIKASSAEKKELNGRIEWVITYNNEKIIDTSKQKLYVFLTMGGDYIAANHTGN